MIKLKNGELIGKYTVRKIQANGIKVRSGREYREYIGVIRDGTEEVTVFSYSRIDSNVHSGRWFLKSL